MVRIWSGRRAVRTSAMALCTVLGLAFASGASGASASPAASGGRPHVEPVSCAYAPAGHARCMSRVWVDAAVAPADAAPPAGYGPNDLVSAYKLPTSRGGGQTVAVIDAYGYPQAESDVGYYRKQYGLPACTSGNGCFRKVNQRGVAGHYPPGDEGWALETALDVDMVSAACPRCHILLVEASSSSLVDLGKAADTAARLGANVISNSYGIDEFNGMSALYPYYRHPGRVVVASTGDDGFTSASFPAVEPGVLAVGGTHLAPAQNGRGWTEKAWSFAGSGCSAYVAKPAYQKDAHCQMRTLADVSAVADDRPGMNVRDTFGYEGQSGWFRVGGTSASSPFIAGVIGLAGDAATFSTAKPYSHTASLFDVVGGSNGVCGGDYLCTGKPGYDGPTGVGTPNGVGGL